MQQNDSLADGYAQEVAAFLRTANKAWRKREKAKLRRQKTSHGKELGDLRRQISQKEPLVNVVHRVAGGYSVKPRAVGMGGAEAEPAGHSVSDARTLPPTSSFCRTDLFSCSDCSCRACCCCCRCNGAAPLLLQLLISVL